ncbi:hypothetical protein GE09DRAFT_1173009 [Coniochaeta sp. 2T2.1]|nr:hypothetical protein GE09DRAFT_1173009 [Coniochaeta sp. 2T2.1]
MPLILFESFAGSEITDVILEHASKLFSENYGIWGKDSGRAEQWLPKSAMNLYTKVTVGGQLAGNVFCSRWVVDGKTICWVTQLVVSRNYRERGLASGLLTSLRREGDDIYGIISSHPAACLAATKSFGSELFDRVSHGIVSGVNTHFMVDHREPLEALVLVRETWNWPLGDLPDGHEYLLILPAKSRRSRSRSLSRIAATS